MGLAFILPNVVVFSIFLLGPVLFAFYISFQEWSILANSGTFVGLDNYVEVLRPAPIVIVDGNLVINASTLTDPTENLWWFALQNTFIYAIGTVPLQIFGGLAVALMLDKRVRAKKAYRAAYFMPVMLSGAAAVMWRWFLAVDGVINSFLEPLGIAHNWAGDPATALGAVMLMSVWGGIGSNMILFLAGLQNTNETKFRTTRIYDAYAEVCEQEAADHLKIDRVRDLLREHAFNDTVESTLESGGRAGRTYKQHRLLKDPAVVKESVMREM
jgi:ABC-type sugar transport system permease subunit